MTSWTLLCCRKSRSYVLMSKMIFISLEFPSLCKHILGWKNDNKIGRLAKRDGRMRAAKHIRMYSWLKRRFLGKEKSCNQHALNVFIPLCFLHFSWLSLCRSPHLFLFFIALSVSAHFFLNLLPPFLYLSLLFPLVFFCVSMCVYVESGCACCHTV